MAITPSLILLKCTRYCHCQDIFHTLDAQTVFQRRTDQTERHSFHFKTRRNTWGCYGKGNLNGRGDYCHSNGFPLDKVGKQQ